LDIERLGFYGSVKMGLFKPNIEKLEAKGDVKGLIKAFKNKHSDPRIKRNKNRRQMCNSVGC
jgi:hypothetical protein